MSADTEEVKSRLDFSTTAPAYSPAKPSSDILRIQQHLDLLQASMRGILLDKIALTDALRLSTTDEERKLHRDKLAQVKEAICDLTDDIRTTEAGLESSRSKLTAPPTPATAVGHTTTSLYAPDTALVTSTSVRPQYYKTPPGLPVFDVMSKDFDLIEFFRKYRAVMLSAAIPSAHWPRMLLSRFAASMHMDQEQYITHFHFDDDHVASPPWNEVIQYFSELYPQPDKVQQFSREFHAMRKTASMLVSDYNNQYTYKAQRAKIVFHGEAEGLKYIESLDPALFAAVRAELNLSKKLAKNARIPFDGSVQAMMRMAFACESEMLQTRLNKDAHQLHVKSHTPASSPAPNTSSSTKSGNGYSQGIRVQPNSSVKGSSTIPTNGSRTPFNPRPSYGTSTSTASTPGQLAGSNPSGTPFRSSAGSSSSTTSTGTPRYTAPPSYPRPLASPAVSSGSNRPAAGVPDRTGAASHGYNLRPRPTQPSTRISSTGLEELDASEEYQDSEELEQEFERFSPAPTILWTRWKKKLSISIGTLIGSPLKELIRNR